MAESRHTTGAVSLSSLREATTQIADHEELFKLFDTLVTIGDVVNAANQQPRFWRDRSMEFTVAGKIIEKLSEAVDYLIEDAARTARELEAPTQFDRDMKALTIARWEVFSRATPVEIVAAVAPLATETH